MKLQIGVIGSGERGAGGKEIAQQIGSEIAKKDCHLLTGACPGIPYAAVKGAKEEGGTTTGISPALNKEEHMEGYQYPVEGHDSMIYTGMGYKGRNVILVRSCDAVVAASGQMGTLNELTIAYGEKKVIGLLKGIHGAADEFEQLAKKIGRPERQVVSSDDPENLVKEILRKFGEI